ncbi:hypothetical protein [Frankia sp. AiPa1]|uniref:hypothetical protein n=1 Tax=Frankia sp. AiPa1 TaxID=573492 RepID=UPI00202B0271|nr:hypothetical protein [Frankia sp. AiPa1]MCL9759369.1 hypothetical protein [Frankia sp. AiPa1]
MIVTTICALISLDGGHASASTPDPRQACGILGLSSDGISGSPDGNVKISVGDPATVVVTNPNILPETVILKPAGGVAQSARLWRYLSSHTFHLPTPGSLQSPYDHSFSITVNGTRVNENSSGMLTVVVKSDLCRFQRNLTVTQTPNSDAGKIGVRLHLSAPAPPVGGYNPNPFVVNYFEETNNGTADKANGIDGRITIPPGKQDSFFTIQLKAAPDGHYPTSTQFLFTGNGNNIPNQFLFTGTTSGLGNALGAGQRLTAGDRLTSPNGKYYLLMQADGNLTEYDNGRPVWASNTGGHPGSDFEAQADGNFVVYAPGHVAIWASGTDHHPDSVFKVQDDRNLAIYAPGNVAVWASNTAA